MGVGKQRIIAAVLLLALAIVIIPYMLNRSNRSVNGWQTIRIPSAPARPSVAAIQKIAIEQPNQPSPKNLADDKVIKAMPRQVRAPLQLKAFSVQAASFPQKRAAEALVLRLQKQDYSAYYLPVINKSGQQIWQVLIGPVAELSEATKLVENLQRKSGLTARLVSYYPLQKHA